MNYSMNYIDCVVFHISQAYSLSAKTEAPSYLLLLSTQCLYNSACDIPDQILFSPHTNPALFGISSCTEDMKLIIIINSVGVVSSSKWKVDCSHKNRILSLHSATNPPVQLIASWWIQIIASSSADSIMMDTDYCL